MSEDPHGEYVTYADYAALRADLQTFHDISDAIIDALEGRPTAYPHTLVHSVQQLRARAATAENELCTAKDQIPPDLDGDSLSVALLKLCDERRALRARLEQVEQGLPGTHKCKHSAYWTTIYDNCVMCERDTLTAQLDITQARVRELERREQGYLSELDDYATTVKNLRLQVNRNVAALTVIASYAGENGCCPYGCDTPHIARQALTPAADTTKRLSRPCGHFNCGGDHV